MGRLEQTRGLVNGLISILQHKHQLVIAAVDCAVKCYLNLLFLDPDGTGQDRDSTNWWVPINTTAASILSRDTRMMINSRLPTSGRGGSQPPPLTLLAVNLTVNFRIHASAGRGHGQHLHRGHHLTSKVM